MPQEQSPVVKFRPRDFIPALMNVLFVVGEDFSRVIFRLDGNILSAYSSDGYVAVSTAVPVENPQHFDWMFSISVEAAEKLLEFTKKVKDLKTRPGFMELSQGTSGYLVREAGTEETAGQEDLTLTPLEDASFVITTISLLAREWEDSNDPNVSLMVLPANFSILHRLKVRPETGYDAKGYPLAFKTFWSPYRTGQVLSVVKYGPDTRLVIAGLTLGTSELENDHPELAAKSLWT